jgi:hypothetical protein
MPNPWEHNPASHEQASGPSEPKPRAPASPELPSQGPLAPPGAAFSPPPDAYQRLGERPGVSGESVRLGYEPERVGVRGLTIFLILFILSAAILHGLVWVLMKYYVDRDRAVDRPRSAFTSTQQPPPAPNLQPSVGHDTLDYQDMEAMRQQEDRMFQKLGWQVDPRTHEVEIPVQIAQRVAEEALARAKAGPVPPTTTGKETNSIVPNGIPKYDTQPGVERGERR